MPRAGVASATALSTLDSLKLSNSDNLRVTPAAHSAGEVKAIHYTSAANSTVQTLVEPTAGKAIRVIAIIARYEVTSELFVDYYFDDGAQPTTTLANAIWQVSLLAGAYGSRSIVFPDGGGPVGAVDKVVSVKWSNSPGSSGKSILIYREE